MNTGILKKVLEELEKENPRLDYIRGMVETLVEMQGPSHAVPSSLAVVTPGFGPGDGGSTPSSGADEAAILDGQARAAIERVKAIAAESNVE